MASANAVSRQARVLASSMSFAPSDWPTRMAVALPMEKIVTAKRLEMVLEMFIAATTFSPRTE